MLAVHLRFTDARTKKPLPVRLRISDAKGATYAPLGRLPVFACGRGEALGGHLRVGQQNFSLIDGSCEIRLPSGVPLKIQAFHGPEFIPFEREVTLGSGQMALRFEMAPWFDRVAANLLSGDSRAHFLSPHDALLEAGTEDLDLVNLLACNAPLHAEDGNTYRTLTNLAAFSGQVPALEDDDRSVVVNTLNEHPMLGRLALLNSHRPIYPTTFGGDDFDDWSLWDWCQQCHRKNGLAVWVNAFRPEAEILGGEALACCILGQIDALEFDCSPRTQPLLPWVYKLWNAGFRVPLVGGSGKQSNRVPLGAMRTYAKLNEGEPRTYASWVNAVREGHSFISNGPILNRDSTGSKVSAESIVPFERLEIVANGRVVASTNAVQTNGIWRAEVQSAAGMPEAGWWAARCIGGAGSPLYPEMPAFAHTSPMRMGSETFDDPTAKIALRQCIEKTIEWVRGEGRFAEEKFRTQMLERCEKALAKLA
jgi:hypothetical protein